MTDEHPTDDVPADAGISRRNVVKAAGATGFGGAIETTRLTEQTNDASTEEQVDDASTEEQIDGADTLDLGGRLIVGDAGYGTIQDAWDAAADGDVVYVHSSYDAEAAGEEFPIVFDQRVKQVSLVGGHPSGSEINAEHSPDRNVVKIYGEGSSDYRNTPVVKNIKITGGNVGLQVVGAPNASFSHLKLFKTNSHGVHITTSDEVTNGCFGTRWYDCEAWSCGGSGFHLDASAGPHGTTFIRCNATWNGWNGHHPGVQLCGFSSVWQSGSIQSNSSYGIRMGSGASQIVRGTYFESNGIESDHPTHLRAQGTLGAVIEANYFQGGMYSGSALMDNVAGHDNVRRAITLHEAKTTSLRSCSFRNHSEGFVAVQGSYALDNDLNEASHHNIGGDDAFLVHDLGDRTRSNGVICEQDLRDVEGKFTCDRGVHDGSGSGSWGPAIWNGNDWISLIDGKAL